MSQPPKAARLLVERFEDALRSGSSPEVDAFLREQSETSGFAPEARRWLLIALVKVDLEYRWRVRGDNSDGTKALLEGYAARLPELGPPSAWPSELIVAEYRNRVLWGDWPELECFLERFAEQRDELRPKLAAIDAERRGAAVGDGSSMPTGSHLWAQTPPQSKLPDIMGYELLEVLGKGGFGIVYKARQPGLEHDVAIKMLLPMAQQDPRAVARFEDEARAISRLRHEHIVRILHIGYYEGSPFLVMEYLEGGPLSAKLREGKVPKPLRPQEAAEIAATLADALEEAHSAGVIHRDLKPSNVLLDARGRPKVADFGLAHLADTERTHSGEIVGTPNYMAPEQTTGRSRDVTPAVDIYALGAILYAMLTGRPPFSGPNAAEVMRKVEAELPQPITSLDPAVPRDLGTICEKCLEKRPIDRFSSAAALRDELMRFLRGEPPTIRRTGAAERLIKWARRKPTLATAYGLAVLALTLFMLTSGALWLRRVAEVARGQAEDARKAMAEARDDAVRLRRVAEDLRGEAETARDEARQLRDQAEKQRLERYRYQHLMATNLIPRLWREGNHFELSELLASVEPRGNEADLRGFEWHYWKRVTGDLRLLKGHAGPIRAMVVTPNGKLVATGGNDKTIWCWNLPAGTKARTLRGHSLPINGLAFSPDGRQLASIACDMEFHPGSGGELKLWDIESGTETASLGLPLSLPMSLTYTPDGGRLITGELRMSLFGASGAITIRDAADGREKRLIFKPRRSINCLTFTPDGTMLAVGTAEGPDGPGGVTLYDAATWAEIRDVGQHERGIWGIAFTRDGKRMVTGGIGTKVRVWDFATGRDVQTLEGHTFNVSSVVLSPDGRRVATGSFDATARIWDVESGKELIALRGHDGFINRVAFSPDGRTLVTTGVDATVRYWDGTAGERYVDEVPTRPGDFASLTFNHDGRFLAWACGRETGSGELGVWDFAERKEVLSHADARHAFFAVAFSPDDRTLAVGTGIRGRRSGEVRMWNLSTGKLSRTLDCRAGAVSRVAFAPGGKTLVSLDQAGPLTIWDTATGERRRVLSGHRLRVFGLAISPDGHTLASGSGLQGKPGGELSLWDAQTGDLQHAFEGVADGITDLAFSPDGRRLVAAGFNEKVRVWDLPTRKVAFELGHVRMGISAAYSPDGLRIATGSFDGSVTIWEASSGHKMLTLTAHDGPVLSLAFRPDGLGLAAVDSGGHLKVWMVDPPVIAAGAEPQRSKGARTEKIAIIGHPRS